MPMAAPVPGMMAGNIAGNMPANMGTTMPGANMAGNMSGNAVASMCGKSAGGKGGMGKSNLGDLPPGAQTIMQAIDDLPPEAAEDPRGFLLRCALPGGIAGRLGGKDGSSIREVEASTGVQISLPGNAADATRMLNI